MLPRAPDSAMGRYVVALLLVGLATVGSVALQSIFSRIPFALYFAAVMLASRAGGLGPGLLASLLSILAAEYFLLPPLRSFGPAGMDEAAMLAILALVSLLIGSMTAQMHASQRSERRQRHWFETTLTSIGDGVIATDGDAKVAFLNPIAEALSGWTRGEAIGRPLADVF